MKQLPVQWTRRAFLYGSATMLAARMPLPLLAQSSSEEIVRSTPSGRVRGLRSEHGSVFRGIQFAASVAGAERFHASRPAPAWQGTLDATRFAPAAMQPDALKVVQSEDCLALNVWVPQGEGPFPVLVWIHGGGFTGGYSYDATERGAHFAASGVVCVTVAYRLGVFGFLDVEPLLGPQYAGSANHAMGDLILALQWVQRNIAAFGGDAARVTVAGESAGAKLTDMLLGVPAAAPLFHQAISESGGAERIWSRGMAQQVAEDFGRIWRQQTSKGVESLKTASVAEILRAQQSLMKTSPVHFPLRGEVDGLLIQRPPLEVIRAGAARGKRVLIGTNHDESALFIGPDPQRPITANDLGNLSLAQFDRVAAQYLALYPTMSEPMRRIRSVTAEEYWVPSMRVAEAACTAGAETYVYRFDYPGRGRFAGLAWHAYELRFVWDAFADGPPTKEDERMAATMHDAWVAFIRGDAPHAAGLPVWPRYELHKRPTMIFDVQSRVADDPAGAELKLWDGLLIGPVR
jgi:para-nitrobenzyl esterase